jgi:aminopeptidase N
MRPMTSTTVALSILGALVIAPAQRSAADPASSVEGARGIGDTVFPDLGNGGIDVKAYRLHFTFDKSLTSFTAVTAMDITAAQPLSSFTLDFRGTPDAVSVNGVSATFARDGADDIRIRPATPIAQGDTVTVQVDHHAPIPKPKQLPAGIVPPSSAKKPYVFSVFQPNAAHFFFPANDHPSDPAIAQITIDSPAPFTGVANGVLASQSNDGGRAVRTWRLDQPTVPDLLQIAVGQWDEINGVGPHGLPLRSFVPVGTTKKTAKALSTIGDQIGWLEQRLGPYPFDVYGIVAPPGADQYGGALETSTMTIVSAESLRNAADVQPLLLHEAAHHWFGNSAFPARWTDVWLNEGHATYYEILWQSEHGGRSPTATYRDIYSYEARMLRRRYGPVAQPRNTELPPYSANAYSGGALALFALHELVGDEVFAKIERTFLDRFHFTAATTADYTAVATEVSGRDLSSFTDQWLYSTAVPKMPGHPKWRAR